MDLFQIVHRFTGKVLFEKGAGSLRLCVEAAVKSRANLTGANLAGADLARANLAGANLARANLTAADLARANLAGANLAGADLAGANLADANLTAADLARANLPVADLTDADLAGADLAGANLADAKNLDKANWGHGQVCTVPPLFIHGQKWPVMISDRHIKIGCEVRETGFWRNLTLESADQVADFDADLWDRFKVPLLALAVAHQATAAEVAASNQRAAE